MVMQRGAGRRAGAASDPARHLVLVRQLSVRCQLVDDVGQVLAEALQQFVARHAALGSERLDLVDAERAAEIARRDLLVGTGADPGVGLIAQAAAAAEAGWPKESASELSVYVALLKYRGPADHCAATVPGLKPEFEALMDELGNRIQRIAQDVLADATPVATVAPQWTGPFTAQAVMQNCTVQPCYYALVLYGRPLQ